MTQVLIVEPDSGQSRRYRLALEDSGFAVIESAPGAPVPGELLASCQCIVANADTDILAVAGSTPVILTTAENDVRRAVSAMKHGARDYLLLPFPLEELVAAVERSIAEARKTTAGDGEAGNPPILGSSPPMKELMARIAKVGPTDSTVLILGESGTGKELVARAIHAASRRSLAPMISLNCATLPTQLLETELFGYSPSDDTPDRTRRGLVEAANGGTLFLDEIGELSVEAQARLLRVLEAGELRRFGSAQSFPIDIRLIAATHRDLNRLIRNGLFREDLYYRLNVVALEIPPLRERGEDVLLLAERMLERTQTRLGKAGLDFSTEARQTLQGYGWPGNVRELANAIERAVILCDGTRIDPEMLAIEPIRPAATEHGSPPTDQTSLEDYFVGFVLANQDEYTETELAEKLGISRKSLWERRQRLNIPRRKTRQRGPRRDPDDARPPISKGMADGPSGDSQ